MGVRRSLAYSVQSGLRPQSAELSVWRPAPDRRRQRAGHFDTTMRMAADVDFFFRVLAAGDLLVVDRSGCDITIHRAQEGAQLSGQAVVMEEDYLLLERFGSTLASERSVRRVANQLSGLCLRFCPRGVATRRFSIGKPTPRVGAEPRRQSGEHGRRSAAVGGSSSAAAEPRPPTAAGRIPTQRPSASRPC